MSFPAVSPSISNSEVIGITKNVLINSHWAWAVVRKDTLLAVFVSNLDAWEFYDAVFLGRYEYSVVKVNEDGTYQEPA